MKEEEVLKSFSPEQMAKLLVGSQEAAKRDKELILWLMEERYRQTEKIKELTGFK